MGLLEGLVGWLMSWFTNSESKLVKDVRKTTVEMCRFLPTIETVVALVAVNNAAVAAASAPAVLIAKKICAAVTARKQGLLGDIPVIVDGVVIEGEFQPEEGE